MTYWDRAYICSSLLGEPAASELRKAIERIRELEAMRAKVLELHVEGSSVLIGYCRECVEHFPCPTARALGVGL